MIEKRRYLETLRKRTTKSRAYKRHQQVGAELAELLRDPKHTALYIKLAMQYDERELRAAAKRAAEDPNVRNPGAYFMRLLQTNNKQNSDKR
ncbi:MAG: hypothetical protein UY81_C0072G0002 [Candidatus Giovannonibacteria bacterium GW2011_GWA2_53_7]|uniref:Uncharacterized protein n=1 Tax=Candidatus Giovannonibacteria bacterium GW2011_GWA2_53_7 TaxID=1618650 RepID=A0A0G1XU52_9BACT|nr:MAG: hypothetical protein UY81_C0072G0002 [Candidatus Giovannonibacteria bacterium GW2011_GWA2_53_7]